VKLRWLVILLVFCSLSNEANAQFWKRKSSKRNTESSSGDNSSFHSATKNQKLPDYPPSKIKLRYRIDVLIPLYLDELVEEGQPVFEHLPDKATNGYQFYEGILLTKDSLNKLGYNLDIYIHDITQEGEQIERLILLKTLVNSDLIIGFLASNQLGKIASFAKKYKINFVSALSPSATDVNDNPFFTIIQPTLHRHCIRLRNKAMEKFPGKNIMMITNRSNPTDSVAMNYCSGNKQKKWPRFDWDDLEDSSALVSVIDTGVTPILLPIVDPLVADSILKQLAEWFPKNRFHVFGMPSWKGVGFLREKTPNFSFTITSAFYIDHSIALPQTLVNNYKKTTDARPTELVYRGYETVYWFAYLLQKYGSVFNNHLNDLSGAAFTSFDIEPQWTRDDDFLYLENEHVYYLDYKDGIMTLE
jgi:hypothetical protein